MIYCGMISQEWSLAFEEVVEELKIMKEEVGKELKIMK